MSGLDDGIVRVLCGDVREQLATMEPGSAQTCVTSPPYWGLRDYGTATWEGGNAECDHLEPVGTLNAGFNERYGNSAGARKQEQDGKRRHYRTECPCGAVRVDAQIGLEPTPDEYVANMVDVFRAVRRVLRDDGTLWLNLGDSYAHGTTDMPTQRGTSARPSDAARFSGSVGQRDHGLKPKDLVGIPWRVALALQADGWYLRSDIIWAKPNPMPESVTDRPTRSHEYVFLLTKSARYYYDADAVREAHTSVPTIVRERGTEPSQARANLSQPQQAGVYGANGRNRRTVWTIATQPYAEAHFATFPEALVEPCILAGCPVQGLVLDPFAGSGTTLAVAKRLDRRAVGIELNPEYIPLIARRVGKSAAQIDLLM